MRLMAVLAESLLVAACGGGNPTLPAPASERYAAEVTFCVDQTNEYRASAGRPALARSAALESYAAAAAGSDGRARVAHQYFERTNGGGIARAENLVPWWPLSSFVDVRNVVRQGLAKMWREGPSGVHYQNIVGAYSQIGCGVLVNGDEVTVVQAFR